MLRRPGRRSCFDSAHFTARRSREITKWALRRGDVCVPSTADVCDVDNDRVSRRLFFRGHTRWFLSSTRPIVRLLRSLYYCPTSLAAVQRSRVLTRSWKRPKPTKNKGNKHDNAAGHKSTKRGRKIILSLLFSHAAPSSSALINLYALLLFITRIICIPYSFFAG